MKVINEMFSATRTMSLLNANRERNEQRKSISYRAVLYYTTCFTLAYLAVNFVLAGVFFGFLVSSHLGLSFAPGAFFAAILGIVYYKRIKSFDFELFRSEAVIYYPLAMLITFVVGLSFGFSMFSVYPNKLAIVSFVGSHMLLTLAMLIIEFSEVNARK